MLSKLEKEKLVIQLLNEEKPYRIISKMAKVSCSEISRIRKKIEGDDGHSSISIRTRAYKMFLEGKQPIDVAIDLDIPHDETRKLWTQFLELRRAYKLLEIMKVLGDKVTDFIKLYNNVKKSGFTFDAIRKGVEVANEIEAQSLYLESLRNNISEAENKGT